jgi:hypothetical protein
MPKTFEDFKEGLEGPYPQLPAGRAFIDTVSDRTISMPVEIYAIAAQLTQAWATIAVERGKFKNGEQISDVVWQTYQDFVNRLCQNQPDTDTAHRPAS